MSVEQAITTPEALPNRIAEGVAELKGEVRQIDRRLATMEQGQADLRRAMEQGQADLRRDVRQVLFLVVAGILVPIFFQLALLLAKP